MVIERKEFYNAAEKKKLWSHNGKIWYFGIFNFKKKVDLPIFPLQVNV